MISKWILSFFLYIKNNKIRRGFLWMKKGNQNVSLIGENGNIFNLMGIASRTLKRNGLKEESEEMIKRIEESHSYDEALMIIADYVEIIGDDFEDEEEDFELNM